jgi:hypothetical protein
VLPPQIYEHTYLNAQKASHRAADSRAQGSRIAAGDKTKKSRPKDRAAHDADKKAAAAEDPDEQPEDRPDDARHRNAGRCIDIVSDGRADYSKDDGAKHHVESPPLLDCPFLAL